MAKKKAKSKPKPNGSNPPKLKDSKLVLVWIPIIVALIGAFATIFVVVWEKPKTFLPNPLLDQAEVALIEGDNDGAIAKAEQAKAVEADNPRIYLVIYAANELSDRHEEAVQALREGTEQVKKRATGGKEIRAVLVAAEVSPEEGLAEVAESYRGFDLKTFVLKFLQVLVRKFPGSERFARMLGEVEAGPEKSNAQNVEIPDNVFTVKDIEALGVLKDGLIDIYAVAEKCGFSQSEVDAGKRSDGDKVSYDLGFLGYDIDYWNELSLWSSPQYNSAGFYADFPGLALPGGARIGMTPDEVLECFYIPPEKKTEIVQQLKVNIQGVSREEYEANYEKYDMLVYGFGRDGITMKAELGLLGDESGGSITYSYFSSDIGYFYSICFSHEGTVRYVVLNDTNDPLG